MGDVSGSGIILLIALFLIYFLPTWISGFRGHPNAFAIFLLNLFFGWSLIGWVGSLIWSVIALKPKS